MAKLMLIGKVAQVELKQDDDEIIATCNAHPLDLPCTWTRRYDDLNDAAEYAQDHADRGEW